MSHQGNDPLFDIIKDLMDLVENAGDEQIWASSFELAVGDQSDLPKLLKGNSPWTPISEQDAYNLIQLKVTIGQFAGVIPRISDR